MRLTLPAVTALLMVLPPPAFAQVESSIALGLSFSVTTPTNQEAEALARPRLLLRLRGGPGIGGTIGFNWFSSAVHTTIAGSETDLGRITVRPLMFGPEYTWELGRLSVSVSAQAGYAFNNIRDTGRAKQAYEKSLGVRGVGIEASDSFAWCPNLSFWFDLTRRFGVMASVGYLGVQPTIATTSSAGVMREKVNLNSVVTSLGVVYAIF